MPEKPLATEATPTAEELGLTPLDRAQRALAVLRPALLFAEHASAAGEPWGGEVHSLLLAASVLLEKARSPVEESPKHTAMRRAVRAFLKSESQRPPALTWTDEMASSLDITRHFMAIAQVSFSEKEENEAGKWGERSTVRAMTAITVEFLKLAWDKMPLTLAKAQAHELDAADLAARIKRLLQRTPRGRWYTLAERALVALFCSAGLDSKSAHRLIPERRKIPDEHAVFGKVRELRKVSGTVSQFRKREPKQEPPA